jgi:uncharacterized protein YlzI (FlbEa/FlbD family)
VAFHFIKGQNIIIRNSVEAVAAAGQLTEAVAFHFINGHKIIIKTAWKLYLLLGNSLKRWLFTS